MSDVRNFFIISPAVRRQCHSDSEDLQAVKVNENENGEIWRKNNNENGLKLAQDGVWDWIHIFIRRRTPGIYAQWIGRSDDI